MEGYSKKTAGVISSWYFLLSLLANSVKLIESKPYWLIFLSIAIWRVFILEIVEAITIKSCWSFSNNCPVSVDIFEVDTTLCGSCCSWSPNILLIFERLPFTTRNWLNSNASPWLKLSNPVSVEIACIPIVLASHFLLCSSTCKPPLCHKGQFMESVFPKRFWEALSSSRHAVKLSINPLA